MIIDSQKSGFRFSGLYAVVVLSALVAGCGGGGGGGGDSDEIRFIDPGPALPEAGGTLPSFELSNKVQLQYLNDC